MLFIDLEKECDEVNREALWKALIMYDVRGKLLSRINCMHVDSSDYVRVKGSEREQLRIESWVRQGCIMSPWLFNVYIDRVMK